MGPVMMDVQGTSLTSEDKELLQHPLVGGLIFFTRNYHSVDQMAQLTDEIRQAAGKPIMLAVDHEGGRVQRFRSGFSTIPAMGEIWQLAAQDINQACSLAYSCAVLMALEVQAVGIDISFAPVLDLNNISDVIGDRAFHQQPKVVSQLADAFIQGLNAVGMKATGKHFPGHGSVKADSHIAMPVDNRASSLIFEQDMQPFQTLIAQNKLAAIMPAHVVYPEVDSFSVGFSRYWLQTILRQQLGFDGVIFSDDLSMKGAATAGGYVERTEAAQQAGCDMLLLCNNRQACIEVLDRANISTQVQSSRRLSSLLKSKQYHWSQLTDHKLWLQAKQQLAIFSA